MFNRKCSYFSNFNGYCKYHVKFSIWPTKLMTVSRDTFTHIKKTRVCISKPPTHFILFPKANVLGSNLIYNKEISDPLHIGRYWEGVVEEH